MDEWASTSPTLIIPPLFNGLWGCPLAGHLIACDLKGIHGIEVLSLPVRAETREWRIAPERDEERKAAMLMTVFILLLALWLLGMISAYTLGGYIHIFLIVAVAVLLMRLPSTTLTILPCATPE